MALHSTGRNLKKPEPEARISELAVVCEVCSPQKRGSVDRVRAWLESGVDWDKAVQAAFDHSVAPLFCFRLLSDHSDLLPADLCQAMQVHVDQHRAKLGEFSGALLTILDTLGTAGIQAIPFKGPALSLRAFADPCIRLCYDLDILLREDDVENCVASLLALGYQHPDGNAPRRLAAERRYTGQYHLLNPLTGIAVEPHWALTPGTMAIDLDYRQMWRQAVTRTFQQRPILAFAPEHEVLMLCIHAAKEGWRSLKPVVDLAGFVQAHPLLDWHSLVSQARQWGCLRMLLLGLQLGHTLLNLDIPPNCQVLVDRDKKVSSLTRELVDRLNEGVTSPMDPYRIDRYALDLRERWLDKLRFVLRTIFTPRANHYEFIDLPNSLRWLYVPVKIGLDYIALPIRHLIGKSQ